MRYNVFMATLDLSGISDLERLHHAYVIEASKDEGFAALRALFGGFGIAMKGNPDLHVLAEDVFLIRHAQELRNRQALHGIGGAKKIFFVAFNTIGHEAQNALLKTLEEPTEGTHFFFVTETREHLLPTFLSRVQVIERKSQVTENQSPAGDAGEKFISASISERMKMIEPMVKAKDDDKPKAKEDARRLLGSLERALYEKLPREILGNDEYASALENIVVAKRHLSGRAPSLKLLLEHLALTVPSPGKEG